MADEIRLNKPWLVAVWPGMGHVAISAGYYLMAKLGMHSLAEFSAEELFDVGHVDVKGGLIRTGRLPQSRLFVWNDPSRQRDLIVFIGEAQPPLGKYAFCRRLIESARQLGVERIFTFAAMATQMHPGDDSRVFGAATDAGKPCRTETTPARDPGGRSHRRAQRSPLGGGRRERAARSMPARRDAAHVRSTPVPESLASRTQGLRGNSRASSIDYTEMSEQAKHMDKELGKLLAQMEANAEQQSPADEETIPQEPAGRRGDRPRGQRHISNGFSSKPGEDRSNAYELKRELDRLALYKEYEDRFLDLFKKPG